MSEQENNQKRSMLSPHVAPFVPKNYNPEFYSSVNQPLENTDAISYMPNVEHNQTRDWNIPIVSDPPVIYSQIPSFQQFIAVGSILQPSSTVDTKYIAPVTNVQNHSNSQAQKNNKQVKYQKDCAIKSQLTANSKESPGKEERRKEKHSKMYHKSSDLCNFKVQNNRKDNEFKKVQKRTSGTTNSSEQSVKFESDLEFPSLPSVSKVENSFSDSNQKKLSQSSTAFSYSAMLKSIPKEKCKPKNECDLVSPVSDAKDNLTNMRKNRIQNRKKNKNVNKTCHFRSNDISEENPSFNNLVNTENNKNHHKNTNVEKWTEYNKVKNKHKDVGYRNKCNFNPIDNDIQHSENDVTSSYQTNWCSKLKKEVNDFSENKNKVSKINKDNTVISKVLKTSKSKQFCTNTTENRNESLTLERIVKKRKRNKKKKKVISDKISLLSPEIFAAITGQLTKTRENENKNFNLCDQQEFPNLDSETVLPDFKSTGYCLKQTDTANESVKSSSEVNDSDYKVVADIFKGDSNQQSTNSWKCKTYGEILKMKSRSNDNVENQMRLETEKSSSSLKKQQSSTAKVKKEKKKKKDATVSSDNPSKDKPDSTIEVSITEIIATKSLQVKSKKKDVKPKVISTKRGVKDKMLNPHNILDSSAPMKKRGKERERPCKKRLSAMRKVILRERKKRNQVGANVSLENENKENFKGKDNDTESNLIEDNVKNIPAVDAAKVEIDRKFQAAKTILHTRKFRDYCNHMTSEEIDSAVTSLVKDLIRFQDRLHERDPAKARMKRRLVQGLREVTKHLRLNKIKAVIIAPDVEKITSEGGLNDALEMIINLAQEQNVPYVFALQRRMLGKLCMKLVPVSCIGIFNYEGSEQNFHCLIELLKENRQKYGELTEKVQDYITEDIETQLLQPSVTPHIVQTIRSCILEKIAEENISKSKCISETLEITEQEFLIN